MRRLSWPFIRKNNPLYTGKSAIHRGCKSSARSHYQRKTCFSGSCWWIYPDWQGNGNDKVNVKLPMKVVAEQIPDKSSYFSFRYGPSYWRQNRHWKHGWNVCWWQSRRAYCTRQTDFAKRNADNSRWKRQSCLVGKGGFMSRSQPNLQVCFRKVFGWNDTDSFPQIARIPLHHLLCSDLFSKKWIQSGGRLKRKNRKIRLNAMTVDGVVCGEQQPESDHFMQSENSQTGSVEDIQWRIAKGWFSYQLRNKENKPPDRCMWNILMPTVREILMFLSMM